MAAPKVERSPRVPEVRKGDTVVILHGKDAGKRGQVERVIRNRQAEVGHRTVWRGASSRPVSVVVAGLNVAKRHQKPRPRSSQSDRVPQMQQGGIIDVAQPLDISNVMVVCPRCERPTRVRHVTLESGQRVRVCHHCGEQLEVKA
ncbi:MAG TPA: 50S ribosomal protein L24 [Candidatus Limnocylindrales bacterium]